MQLAKGVQYFQGTLMGLIIITYEIHVLEPGEVAT